MSSRDNSSNTRSSVADPTRHHSWALNTPGELQIQLNQELYNRYPSSQNYYYSRDINEIIFKQEGTSSLIRFKDWLAYDEEIEEYFQEFYQIKVYPRKITYLTEYYKFHNDMPRLFMEPLNNVMIYYHEQQRKIKYVKITRMLKLQQQEQEGQCGEQQQQQQDEQQQQQDMQSADGHKSDTQKQITPADSSQGNNASNHKKHRKGANKNYIDASVSMDNLLGPLESFLLNYSKNNKNNEMNRQSNNKSQLSHTKSAILNSSSRTLIDLQQKLTQIIQNNYGQSDISQTSSVCTISSSQNHLNQHSIGNLTNFLKFQEIQHRISLVKNSKSQQNKSNPYEQQQSQQSPSKMKQNIQSQIQSRLMAQQQPQQQQLLFTSASNKISGNSYKNSYANQGKTHVQSQQQQQQQQISHQQKELKEKKLTSSTSTNQFEFRSQIQSPQHVSPSGLSAIPSSNTSTNNNNGSLHPTSQQKIKGTLSIPLLRLPSNSTHSPTKPLPSVIATLDAQTGLSSKLISQKIYEQIKKQQKDNEKTIKSNENISSHITPGNANRRQNVTQRLNSNTDKNSQRYPTETTLQNQVLTDHGSLSARRETSLKLSIEIAKNKHLNKKQSSGSALIVGSIPSSNSRKDGVNQINKNEKQQEKVELDYESESPKETIIGARNIVDSNKIQDKPIMETIDKYFQKPTMAEMQKIPNSGINSQPNQVQEQYHSRRSNSIHQSQPFPIGIKQPQQLLQLQSQQQYNSSGSYGARIDGLLSQALGISTVPQSPQNSFPCFPLQNLLSHQQQGFISSNTQGNIPLKNFSKHQSPPSPLKLDEKQHQFKPFTEQTQQTLADKQQQFTTTREQINNGGLRVSKETTPLSLLASKSSKINFPSFPTESASEAVSPKSAAVSAKTRHQSHHSQLGFSSSQLQQLQTQYQLIQQQRQSKEKEQQIRNLQNIQTHQPSPYNAHEQILTERPISPSSARQHPANLNLFSKTQQTLGRDTSNPRTYLNSYSSNLIITRPEYLQFPKTLQTDGGFQAIDSSKGQTKSKEERTFPSNLHLNLQLLESARSHEQLPLCRFAEDPKKSPIISKAITSKPTPSSSQHINHSNKQQQLQQEKDLNNNFNQKQNTQNTQSINKSNNRSNLNQQNISNSNNNNSSKSLLKCHSAHHSRTGSLKGVDVLKIAQQQQQQQKQQFQQQIQLSQQQSLPSSLQLSMQYGSSRQSPSVAGNHKKIIFSTNNIPNPGQQPPPSQSQLQLERKQPSLQLVQQSSSQRASSFSNSSNPIENIIQTIPSPQHNMDSLGKLSQISSRDFVAQLNLQQQLSKQQHQHLIQQQQLHQQQQLQLQKQIQIQLQQELLLSQQQQQQQQQEQWQRYQQSQQPKQSQMQQEKQQIQQQQQQQQQQFRLQQQSQQNFQASQRLSTQQQQPSSQMHNNYIDGFLTDRSHNYNGIVKRADVLLTQPSPKQTLITETLPTAPSVSSTKKQTKKHQKTKSDLTGTLLLLPQNPSNTLKQSSSRNNTNINLNNDQDLLAFQQEQLQLLQFQKDLHLQSQFQQQQIEQQQSQKHVKVQRQNSTHQTTTSSSLRSTTSPMSNINGNITNTNNVNSSQAMKDIYFSQLASSSSSFLGHSRSPSIQKISQQQQQQQQQQPQSGQVMSQIQLVHSNSAASSNSSKQYVQSNNLYYHNNTHTLPNTSSNLNYNSNSNNSSSKHQSQQQISQLGIKQLQQLQQQQGIISNGNMMVTSRNQSN